ncbi:MAG: NAD(P)H-dependent oxidoreductase, partial [Bacillota bacterium]|nr:NAD(P)H-dependent oxidoreductase [Bacillota bacterium]
CKACKYCLSHEGECVEKDGMIPIMEALYHCDMLVLSTPVYFFGLTAQIKAVIDRLYPVVVKPLPVKEAVFMSVMADVDMETMVPSVTNFKELCKYLKWDVRAILTAGGIDEPGDIEGHEILEQAEKLGSSIK